MALFAYFKGEPSNYIMAMRNGRAIKRGVGRSFWYWQANTSLVRVPISTIDALFMLNETTSNFQPVSLQGQLTYRIVKPEVTASLLNFTIDPKTGEYLSEDPAKLSQRIINIVQTHTRSELRKLTLEEALQGSHMLSQGVLEKMQAEPMLAELGVECLSIFFISIKSTPETARALEAQYREALQQRADQAIYARRAEAVEQERKIKQNELATAVALEERRRELIALEGENARRQAEFAAEAIRIEYDAYQGLDQRLLLALAFRNFADNAEKIGNLNISSELLEQLINRREA